MRVLLSVLLMTAVLSGCTTTQSLDYTQADAAQLATLAADLNEQPVAVTPLRGARLRVIFLRLDTDSARFLERPTAQPRPRRTYTIDVDAIHAIEHTESPLRPAVTGGVVGFFGGLLGGFGFSQIACGQEGKGCEQGVMIGTGVLGGLIGAFIGAANPKVTRYVLNHRRPGRR